MTTLIGTMASQRARDIPSATHAEASALAQIEYARVLALLEQLEGDDWTQPTFCTAWNVQQMVAHLAGAVTGCTTFAEFRRQNLSNPYLKETNNPVDGTNKLQVLERADKTPAELVAEFRQNGQIAVNNRRDLPWLVRKIHLPMGPLGFASIEYLMDIIYPRDEWMHRYDICAATGRQMVMTPEHDGRITELVLRDIAKKLNAQMAHRTVALHLGGAIEDDYLFGRATTPDCTLEMDIFDFSLRASGRIAVTEATARAHIEGDHALATWFLSNMEVPY